MMCQIFTSDVSRLLTNMTRHNMTSGRELPLLQVALAAGDGFAHPRPAARSMGRRYEDVTMGIGSEWIHVNLHLWFARPQA